MAALLRGRARAVTCGLLADRMLGEPPTRIHPVGAFGRLMQHLEDRFYAPTRTAGCGYAAAGFAVGLFTGAMLPTSITVALTAAGNALRAAAADVRDALLASDVPRARALIPALVGRDPDHLDVEGLVAAIIESLAENTVDAVVAPVWWAMVGGSAAAGAYRAINTMDAMVGHHTHRYENYGWASAVADDVANYFPARITALLTAAVRPQACGRILQAVWTQASIHPSPNAGIAEAAFAVALGIELGGPVHYQSTVEHRPRLGHGPRPSLRDVDRAITLASHVEIALIVTIVASSIASTALQARRHRAT